MFKINLKNKKYYFNIFLKKTTTSKPYQSLVVVTHDEIAIRVKYKKGDFKILWWAIIL